MARITSRQNAIVAQFKRVARGEDAGLILLDGVHLVADALASGVVVQHALVESPHDIHSEVGRLARELDRRGVDLREAAPDVMAAASPVRSGSPIVALAARPGSSGSALAGASPLVVIACDVQDPGNLGAITRVAEAAGATGLVVAGQSADPFGWKALRGSMGSALRLPIATSATAAAAVADARARGLTIAATVPRSGVSMYDATLSVPLALLVGGEGAGLASAVIESADVRLSIPMTTPVESLNAAVATAVLLYEARRQRTLRRRAPHEEPHARVAHARS
ncbi:MAG: TrmH family RNA methyltransferase [Vicinamibacterales bacterium]